MTWYTKMRKGAQGELIAAVDLMDMGYEVSRALRRRAAGQAEALKYSAIMADPPWPQQTIGKFKRRHKSPDAIKYGLMFLEQIARLRVAPLAAEGCHLWLWATNTHLPDAFAVMRAWGATYLSTLTFVKPSGFGAYFANTTQHLLFGYYGKCALKERWLPTNYEWVPRGHSRKPDHAYRLVERVSFGPYLELFARERRFGWDSLGNEVDGLDIHEALRCIVDKEG